MEIIDIIRDFLGQFGIWGILLLMFLENIGLPLPTELGFILGQGLVTSGKFSYAEIFVVILIGKTTGSIISFFVGKYFSNFVDLNKSSKRREAKKIFDDWMKKYGNWAVFISRVIGYIRPWSSYIAGFSKMKFWHFIFYNILGSAIIILLTMLVLGSAVEIWQRYEFFRPIAIALFLVFFFGFWIGVYLYRKFKS